MLDATDIVWYGETISDKEEWYMLNDNIKALRKERGMTQEELAIRLNVVRQTVSKWEKGLSVPDAEMLQRLADALEISVSRLLGGSEERTQNTDEVASQLARINEQLAVQNRRQRKIWKTVAAILIGLVAAQLLILLLSYAPDVDSDVVPAETAIAGYQEIVEP